MHMGRALDCGAAQRGHVGMGGLDCRMGSRGSLANLPSSRIDRCTEIAAKSLTLAHVLDIAPTALTLAHTGC